MLALAAVAVAAVGAGVGVALGSGGSETATPSMSPPLPASGTSNVLLSPPLPPATSLLVTSVVVAGTVDDFTPNVRTALRSNVAQAAGVALEAVALDVISASVRLSFTIALASDSAADDAASTLSTSMASPAAASTLLTTPTLTVQVQTIEVPPTLTTPSGDPLPAAPLPVPPPAPPASPTTQTVARSGRWELISLVKVRDDPTGKSSRWPTPCARSYEGHAWEVVMPRPNDQPLVQVVSCATNACQLIVPDEPGYTYSFRTIDLSSKYGSMVSRALHARVASHLLIQGSFGPTRATIGNLTDAMEADSIHAPSSPAAGAPPPALVTWVYDQIEMPATTHRAYLRHHVNPRHRYRTDVTRPRDGCEVGSRWSRVAIRGDDIPSILSIHHLYGGTESVPDPNAKVAIYVDGVLRTETSLDVIRPWGGLETTFRHNTEGTLVLGVDYTICDAQEWRNGLVSIGSGCETSNGLVEFLNVFTVFEQLTPPTADHIDEPITLWQVDSSVASPVATLTPLPDASPWNDGVLLLSELHGECPLSIPATLAPSTILQHDGLYYRFDPRASLLENTLEVPANLTLGTVGQHPVSAECQISPNTPKTIFNEAHCAIAPACLSYDGLFQLNASTLRAMYVYGAIIALALDGLPLKEPESPVANKPCGDMSRWLALGGSCSLHGGESTLDATAHSLLVAALRDNTCGGWKTCYTHNNHLDNTILKDIELTHSDEQQCNDDANAVGARLEVDGECWQNTNPYTLTVYDYTHFATGMDHPGNDPYTGFWPIKKLALRGETRVTIPSSHHDNRLKAMYLNMDKYNPRIGRLGDWISWEDLPPTVRSPGLASYLGLRRMEPSESPMAVVETCGTPGEVALDPQAGNHFNYNIGRWKAGASNQQHEMLKQGTHNSNTPSVVHATIALFAPDQLRQRVAWALAQVVVVGKQQPDNPMYWREIWLNVRSLIIR